MNYMRVRNSD